MKTYKPTIGLEIHAELRTNTKMFCNSKNEPHAGEPNAHVCPVCMGHPGTLPVINKTAVEHVLRVGQALGSELATYTEFDRKNYFYPDIPKGYQISQYLYPLVKGGELNGVQITRVHLEEDTARSLHDQGEGSIIDYNRAGVPLMELVTEPVIHDSKTAGNFARELQLLLRTLGVSEANMEKGEMRVEANISVSSDESFGTKVEVKNLNSFKSVESAIEYEIKRHIEVLENGGILTQETRGWDEIKGMTFSQRVKESANDYRYFPDPDLPKLSVTSDTLSRLKENISKSPSELRLEYSNLGLTIEQIEAIISNNDVNEFYQKVIARLEYVPTLSKLVANYLLTDLLPHFSGNVSLIGSAHVDTFASLIKMVESDAINSRVAKDMLYEVVIEGKIPEKLAEDKGLFQKNDEESLQQIVKQVISENPAVVAEFKTGKETALQFLVGQGMKISKGSVNPKLLADYIKNTIKSL